MQLAYPPSRRSFLHAAALGATAAAGVRGSHSRLFAAEEEEPRSGKKRYMKAVKIGMVRTDGSLLKKFQLLKRLGFDGIELNSPSSLKLIDVKRARDEAELPVHGVVDSTHWSKTLSHPDPAIRAAQVKDLTGAVRDSKAYGGTSVLLVPGVVNDEATYEQAWERSIPEIKKVLPLAEDMGIHVLIENVWNNFLTDPQETARYIDELDSPMAGSYFDVGNAVRYAPPVEWIRALGKRIVKLDIKEYSNKVAKKEGNPGAGFGVKLLDGECDWPAVMDELEKLNFAGWGTAEIPGGGEERLAEIASRMDRIFAS